MIESRCPHTDGWDYNGARTTSSIYNSEVVYSLTKSYHCKRCGILMVRKHQMTVEPSYIETVTDHIYIH